MTAIKSKLEARQYAIEKAVELMGTGSPSKDVVAKAVEIETYIVGGAELPEVSNDTAQLMNMLGDALANIAK